MMPCATVAGPRLSPAGAAQADYSLSYHARADPCRHSRIPAQAGILHPALPPSAALYLSTANSALHISPAPPACCPVRMDAMG